MLDDTGSEIDEELLEIFLNESFEVMARLHTFVAEFNNPKNTECFEKFGQQIDRIMGAAYTLSLTEVGDLAKLGKELGYKSSQVTDVSKLLVVQSLLSQLVKNLEVLLKGFKKRERIKLEATVPLLQSMTSASKQLGNLRTSVKL